MHRDETRSCARFYFVRCFLGSSFGKWSIVKICYPFAQLLIEVSHIQTCGYIFPWRTAAKILAAIPLVSAVAILLFPETPYWLIENGRDEEAR